ncbi:MAG TPA: MFS transporter, partial [Rhodopila sp.]|nr:MFS transporter [Rhodopila sp.]
GMMGIGGVTSGMLLPMVRGKLSRGATVVGCTLLSCAGMAVVGVSRHWIPAAFGMLLFGLGWTSAFATIQAAAQLVCPPWVRARALSIYQLAQNGALTIGSFGWGWLGDRIGLSHTFLAATAVGLGLMLVARLFSIETITRATPADTAPPAPLPEAPAAEFVPLLRKTTGRIMEIAYYHVEPGRRSEFLAIMDELHHVRGRAGALSWQVYEDVAHPDGWIEVWFMESWTDHLREAIRLSDEDKRLLASASVFQHEAHRPSRYLAVDPHDYLHANQPHPPGRARLPIARPQGSNGG